LVAEYFERECMMHKNSESGYVLVTVAALLFVLLGFTALAVDMGTVLSSRTQLQRAADAAALAGAYAFIANPNATETMAQDRAKAVLAGNKDMGTAIDSTTGVTVSVKCPSCTTTSTVNQVTVTVQRTESTIFGAAFDIAGVADQVTATAESGTSATGSSCVKPWFLPNTVADTSDPPCTASDGGYVLFSKSGDTWQTTTFGKNNLGVQIPVKAQDSKNTLQPGQFYEIDMSKYSANGGAKTYANAISGCNTYQFTCQNSYDTLSGNKMGPTAQGVCQLIAGDKDCSKGTLDSYINLGRYDWGDGSGIHDTSKALVIVPVVDLSSVTGFCPTNSLASGSGVPVVGFAQIFIETADKSADTLTVRVVNLFACGPAGGDGSNTGTPVPLRLIRTQ
jgi:Flp pilus assembly protein TadG